MHDAIRHPHHPPFDPHLRHADRLPPALRAGDLGAAAVLCLYNYSGQAAPLIFSEDVVADGAEPAIRHQRPPPLETPAAVHSQPVGAVANCLS